MVSKVNIQMKRLLLWQDIQDIRNFHVFWPPFWLWKNCEMHKNHTVPIKYNPLLNSLAEQFFYDFLDEVIPKTERCKEVVYVIHFD